MEVNLSEEDKNESPPPPNKPIEISHDELMKFTVNELKSECRKRELAVSGNKGVLQKRLKDNMHKPMKASSPEPLVPKICVNVDRKGPLKKALEYLTRTKVQGSDSDHQPCVCVICDSFIIGTEKICYLSKEQILKKTSYLHLSYLENMIGEKIPSTLHNQY